MSDNHESLFKSVLRSFFKGFFSIVGIFLAIIIFLIFIGSILSSKDAISPRSKTTLQTLPDHNGNIELLSDITPVILQIDIHGIIGMGDSRSEIIEKILIDSRREILKNNRVKGILLHVNTRGGAVTDSDNIYRMLLEYKKKYNIPIYAYVDGISASGGVYITSSADKIFASPTSIIGSVGTLSGPFINVSKSLEKLGIDSLTITEGKNKDALNPLRPWKEDEQENFKMLAEYYYQMFLEVVSNSRPKLTKELLISTYGAKVFPSPEAEKNGYIDHGNSDYKTALIAILKAANIKADQKYQVFKIKTKKSFFEELFENSELFKGKINHQIKLGNFDNETKEKTSFQYLY